MILTIVILGALVIAFRQGMRRGMVALLLKVLGFIVIACLSLYLAPSVGQRLQAFVALQGVSFGFYQMLAFWLVALIGGLIFRWISSILNMTVKSLPLISQADSLLGGVVSFLMMYGVIFFLLLLAASWPNDTLNAAVNDSIAAEFILTNTPLISQQIMDNWLSMPTQS